MKNNRTIVWSTPILLFAILACRRNAPLQLPHSQSGKIDVAVEGGTVRGDVHETYENIAIFRGIPYAQPPFGHLRWRPPQPVKAWEGVRETNVFGPACVQPEHQLFRNVAEEQQEDCLTLNIWTAAIGDELKPVKVWIHGGGFTTGSGSRPAYNGAQFAESGVVLVTFNYRLGPFGFFAHPALSAESSLNVSGNYGLLDQIAALKWVKQNISAFGGDPEKVTIFGESAGSVSVAYLLAAPEAKGLFHRAIMQSGLPSNTPKLRSTSADSLSGEAMGIEIAGQLGLSTSESDAPKTAAQLRQISAETLLLNSNPRVGLFGEGRRMGPLIDGFLLPTDSLTAFAAGSQHDVPILIGSNADEGTLFLQQIPINGPLAYKKLVALVFEDIAGQVLELFPAPSRSETKPALANLVTAAAFVCPACKAVRLLESQGVPVWLYHFSRVAPGSINIGLGATHGAEIYYVFNNLPGGGYVDDTDTVVANAMHSAWVRFAVSGNPNGGSLPFWPAYTYQNDAHMAFDDKPVSEQGLLREACDMLDEIGDS